MSLKIEQRILRRIPGLWIVGVEIELSEKQKEIDAQRSEYLEELWKGIFQEFDSGFLENQPEMKPWVQLWSELGVSLKKHPPSILSLFRRATKGGTPPRIHPLVDCYNALSLELRLPFGAFDPDDMDGGLQVRESEGGERFLGIGSGQEEETSPQEIVYADDKNILTRHFLWRQSQKGKISQTSQRAIIVCELLHVHIAHLHKIRETMESRIRSELHVKSLEWFVRN